MTTHHKVRSIEVQCDLQELPPLKKPGTVFSELRRNQYPVTLTIMPLI